MIPVVMNSFTRMGAAALVASMAAGCVGLPEDVEGTTSEVLTYDQPDGVFENSIRRMIRYTENTEKYFEIGRIEPESSVTSKVTRTAGYTGPIQLEVQFSADGVTYTTPAGASGACSTNIGAGVTTTQTCTRTSAASDRFARIRILAVNSTTDAVFRLDESHVPPVDEANHAHYGTDTITVTTWDENGNDPDRRWARVAGTAGAPVYPGVLQFQRVVLTITRNDSTVNMNRLNGPKLKTVGSSSNVEIADVGCPMDANGNFDWVNDGDGDNNRITCVLEVAPKDGELRIPFTRPDNNHPNASATVVITRTSPNTAQTGSVRTDLTAAINN